MASMRSAIVVLLERPLSQNDSRLEHGVEILTVELLGAHGSVEALDETVLLRLSLFDVSDGNAQAGQPGLQGAGDELPAVVAANDLRLPGRGEELLRLGHHVGGSN